MTMAGGELSTLREEGIRIRKNQLTHTTAPLRFFLEDRSRKAQSFTFSEYQHLAGRLLCAHENLSSHHSFVADQTDFHCGFGFDRANQDDYRIEWKVNIGHFFRALIHSFLSEERENFQLWYEAGTIPFRERR